MATKKNTANVAFNKTVAQTAMATKKNAAQTSKKTAAPHAVKATETTQKNPAAKGKANKPATVPTVAEIPTDQTTLPEETTPATPEPATARSEPTTSAEAERTVEPETAVEPSVEDEATEDPTVAADESNATAATEETALTTDATATEATGPAKPSVQRDPRLPAIGTVLQRTDRYGNVRCECTVEEGGFRYAGKLYKSPSAAAIVAAQALGHKSKTQNGLTFWQLTKPVRRIDDTLSSLDQAGQRYRTRAAQILKDAPAELQQQLRQLLTKQAAALASL